MSDPLVRLRALLDVWRHRVKSFKTGETDGEDDPRWCRSAWLHIDECADELDALIVVLQADVPRAESPQDWQDIATAPERRKVLVTWVNALGNRRTAMASYWPEGTLEMADDVPDYQVNEAGTNLDAGWWEESEGNDDAMFRLIEQMTHWRPLPPVASLSVTRGHNKEQA